MAEKQRKHQRRDIFNLHDSGNGFRRQWRGVPRSRQQLGRQCDERVGYFDCRSSSGGAQHYNAAGQPDGDRGTDGDIFRSGRGNRALTYQWQKNNANISGATSASYTTPATISGDSGATFRVMVTNSVTTITSNSATLTVNPASVGPSITTQPSNQTVTVGQTAIFSVVAAGTAPLTYQWQKNNLNISGATAASYTTPATVSGDNGATFRAIVTNPVTNITSNSATLTVNPVVTSPGTDVTTYHNDIARTGQNTTETKLTQANVNSTTFGLLRNLAVDGRVDAEPLYLSQLSVAGTAHNVVFIVTEHDSAYAFDSDTGAQLWKVSLLGSGETSSDDRGCGQVSPEIGITSTPVIDRAAGAHGILYAVAMSKNGATYFQRLHALDITTGAELEGGPVTSSGDVSRNRGQQLRRTSCLRSQAIQGTSRAASTERRDLYELGFALRLQPVHRVDHGIQPNEPGANERPQSHSQRQRRIDLAEWWRAGGRSAGKHLRPDGKRHL